MKQMKNENINNGGGSSDSQVYDKLGIQIESYNFGSETSLRALLKMCTLLKIIEFRNLQIFKWEMWQAWWATLQ